MKIACTLVVLAAVATLSFAAVAIYPPEEKPAEFADQQGCYIRDLNRVLPFEEPVFSRDGKTCVQYTCHTNGETQLFSCGAVQFSDRPGNCRIVEDFSLDYPKCCKTIVCDNDVKPAKPTCINHDI